MKRELVQTIVCPPVSRFISGNPNNHILSFEETILFLLGLDKEKYDCVITDSFTSGLLTVLDFNKFFNRFPENKIIKLPERTYQGVYQALLLDNDISQIELIEDKWEEYYIVDNWVDCATTMLQRDTTAKDLLEESEFLIFSFSNQKPIRMNRGGAIVFKKEMMEIGPENNKTTFNKYDFFKRYLHDGRDSAIKVGTDNLLRINGNTRGTKRNLVPEHILIGLKYIETNLKSIINHPIKGYKDYDKIVR